MYLVGGPPPPQRGLSSAGPVERLNDDRAWGCFCRSEMLKYIIMAIQPTPPPNVPPPEIRV